MVKIILPVGWTQGGPNEFAVAAGLLPEVIRRFAADQPGHRDRVLGPDAELLTYVNYCVGEELVPRQDRATTMVPDGGTVVVIAPMAGG